jgi:hypothetical protein
MALQTRAWLRDYRRFARQAASAVAEVTASSQEAVRQSRDLLDQFGWPRARLKQYLAQARERVARSEKNVARQRKIVAELERDGHDGTGARQWLAHFQEILAMQIADRDRAERELASSLSNRPKPGMFEGTADRGLFPASEAKLQVAGLANDGQVPAMCGRVIQSSGPLRYAIVDGLDVCRVRNEPVELAALRPNLQPADGSGRQSAWRGTISSNARFTGRS